jgi:hypothetical protein
MILITAHFSQPAVAHFGSQATPYAAVWANCFEELFQVRAEIEV